MSCGGKCGCKGGAKAQAACDPYPGYRDSEVLGGDYWPGIAVYPLPLASEQELTISSLSDVRRTMLIDVTDGVVHFWWKKLAGRPRVGGDEPHLTFGVQSEPAQIILPPGHFEMVFGAGGGSACVACVTLLDRDPHE